MTSLLHNERHKRRAWTPQDQATAEVVAACGVKYVAIGRVLGYAPKTVKFHLTPVVAERKRETARNYYELNPDAQQNATRRWLEVNPCLKQYCNCRYYESSCKKYWHKALERQRSARQKKKLEKTSKNQLSGE